MFIEIKNKNPCLFFSNKQKIKDENQIICLFTVDDCKLAINSPLCENEINLLQRLGFLQNPGYYKKVFSHNQVESGDEFFHSPFLFTHHLFNADGRAFGHRLVFYDNNTFIAESFPDKETAINIVISTQHNKITDIITTSQELIGELRKPGMSYIKKTGKKKIFLALLLSRIPSGNLKWNNTSKI